MLLRFACFVGTFRGRVLVRVRAGPCDLVLNVGYDMPTAATVLGRFRVELAQRHRLIPTGGYALLWVVDFPMFEWSVEERRWQAMHHPFTAPRDEDVHLLDGRPGEALAKAYDLGLNGQEVGGGSIRIH